MNISFRDQYTITSSPALPRIISHLGMHLVIATEFLPRPFQLRPKKSSRGSFVSQSPPRHHMIRVSITFNQLYSSEAVNSEAAVSGELRDQASTEDQKCICFFELLPQTKVSSHRVCEGSSQTTSILLSGYIYYYSPGSCLLNPAF